MRKGLLAVGLILLWSFPSQAQEQGSKPRNGHGYVFGAVAGHGRHVVMLHFGGGGEAQLYKGLGLGGEIGYLSHYRAMGSGVGLASLNALYDFGRERKVTLSPFVTGGYSLAFRCCVLNAVNFGGGINYWVSDRTALRIEFRDHVTVGSRTAHVYSFRIGLNLR